MEPSLEPLNSDAGRDHRKRSYDTTDKNTKASREDRGTASHLSAMGKTWKECSASTRDKYDLQMTMQLWGSGLSP